MATKRSGRPVRLTTAKKPTKASAPSRPAAAGQRSPGAAARSDMEERYAAIISVAPVGIAQLDNDRQIQYVNDQMCAILGHRREQLVGRRLKEFSHPDDNETTEAAVVELLQSPASTSSIEKRYIRGDGLVVWTRLTMTNPLDPRFPLHRVVVLEDISARKEAEARLDALSHLHLASGEINEAILRTRQEQELLEDVCKIIVKHCGFEIASMRIADETGKAFKLAASEGPLVEWIRAHPEKIAVDSPEGAGLGPEAYRSGRPCVTNDYTYDARFFGRDTPEQRAGLRSAAAFPLKRLGRSIGLLLVGSRQKELFDDGMVGLLEHIAENVSYALEKFEQETEQERAEQALRASEARFRGLVELATDTYWEQDAEFRFVRISDSNVSAPLARQDALGKRRWEIPGSEPLARGWPEHIATLEARLPFRNFEYRHLRGDGSYGYIAANGEPMFDAEGRFSGYRGTARDITAAKRDEWALRRFRTALDQSSELVLLIEGGTGRILDFNDSVCHALGWTREELVGQSLDTVVVGRSRDEIRARNQALLEVPDRRDQVRRTYRRKDGSTMEVEVVRRAMSSPEGSIVVAIGRDLTYRLANERRIAESEERFRQLVENIPQVFWIIDVRTRSLLYISPDHEKLLGRQLPGQPSAEDWLGVIHPQDRDRIRSAQSTIGMVDYNEEYRVVWPDGSIHWLHSRAFPIRNEAGEMLRVAGLAEDVTERRLADRRVRRQAKHEECIARFGRQALEEKDIGLLMTAAARAVQAGLGMDDVILFELDRARARVTVRAALGAAPAAGSQSEALPALVGAIEELDGGAFAQDPAGAAQPPFMPPSWTGSASSTIACPIRAGESALLVIAAMSSEQNAFSPEEAGFLEAVSSLVSTALQRHESEARLAYLAQFDSLTGLANRSLLRDRLAQAVAQGRRQRWSVGVLFVDLDRFKLVNDTLGHSTGDQLLAEAARRLQSCVRAADTVGRISGDEFALVLADLGRPDDAAIVCRKVLDALSESFQLGEHEAFVSGSIGIAIFPGDGDDADSLIKNADTAMYRAKEAGRNDFCFFTSEMNQRSQHRLQLAGELRRAIEREEFRLYYQPKIDLIHGSRICGLEALLRWQHPERGLVAPDEFIPVLEETGLIMPVGAWVLREACRQVRHWRDAGLEVVPVAVNLSARQFRDKELDRLVQDCARDEGIDTGLIELEITESHLMENPAAARSALQRLRDAGIRISVDDFGTGYSSLSYLTQFPLTALKIDRSFVRNVNTQTDAASIVKAIINMARSLRFITIAEGVEEDRQVSFLRQFGCDQAQGFLFSPPVSAGDAAERLSRR